MWLPELEYASMDSYLSDWRAADGRVSYMSTEVEFLLFGVPGMNVL